MSPLPLGGHANNHYILDVCSVIEWLEDRPKHMLNVENRELKVDFKSYSNPVREKVGGDIAVRVLAKASVDVLN